MNMTLREAQRLLKIAQRGDLYCKSKRDAIIIYAFNQKMSLAQTDDLLFEFQQPTLVGAL